LVGFQWAKKRVAGVVTKAAVLHADRFLISTGAWTDPMLEPVGWKLGIRPVRGQIALLNTGEKLFHKILLQGKRYLVPRADGQILVGATEEHVGFDKRTTAWAISDLLSFAMRLVPSLANAPLERCWAGLRPGSPDGLPFIGRVPDYDNLYVAAGHFRAGIQWSPVTGLIVKELLLNQNLTMPIEPFRLDRVAAAQTVGALPS
jgi:glycine oxidase